MYLGSMLGVSIAGIVDSIWWAVCWFLYWLWSCIAWIADIIEEVFMMLAGIKNLGGEYDGSNAGGIAGDVEVGDSTNNIVELIIQNKTIQNVFYNMIIIAVILLMFFTILKIIQEQYKNKDGGNPYVIVFRMFKGMITFLFITAAVLVGLQLSGVVLGALNAATGKKEGTSISGEIFIAMAYNANRVRMHEKGAFNGTDEISQMRLEQYNMIPRDSTSWNTRRQKEHYILHKGFEETTTEQGYYVRIPANHSSITWTKLTFTFADRRANGKEGDGENYVVKVGNRFENMAAPVEWLSYNFDKRDENFVTEGGLPWYTYDERGKRHSFGYNGVPRQEAYDNAFADWKDLLYSIKWFANQIESVNDHKFYIDNPIRYNDLEEVAKNSVFIQDEIIPFYDWRYGSDSPDLYVQEFSIFYPKLVAITSSMIGETPEDDVDGYLRDFIFNPLINSKKIGYKRYQSVEPDTINDYSIYDAQNIDKMMKTKPKNNEKDNYYLYKNVRESLLVADLTNPNFVQEGTPGEFGTFMVGNTAASYSNAYAVGAFYLIQHFDFIIGFLGIFIVIGVYCSFAFGLVGRILELAVLYIMSPITLSMYPFDDGASFQNNFVKPFYKKVISVYAVVLSLNLFFIIYPIITSINFFDQKNSNINYLKNRVMGVFMTIAMLALLPKIRNTITQMLQADSIEEKSLKQMWQAAGAELSKGGAGYAKAGIKGAKNIGQRTYDNYRIKSGAAAEKKAKEKQDKDFDAVNEKDAASVAAYDEKYGGAGAYARMKNQKEENAAKLKDYESGMKAKDFDAKYNNGKEGGFAAFDAEQKAAAAKAAAKANKKPWYKSTMGGAWGVAGTAVGWGTGVIPISAARQAFMGTSLGQAMFDMDDGVLMQGKFGKAYRENFGRMEAVERRKKMMQNREKRRATAAEDLGEAAKLAEMTGENVEKVIAAARAAGFDDVNTLEDVKNLSKSRFEKAAEEQRAAVSKKLSDKYLGSMLNDIESREGKDARDAAEKAIHDGKWDDLKNAGANEDEVKMAQSLREGNILNLLKNGEGRGLDDTRLFKAIKDEEKQKQFKDAISRGDIEDAKKILGSAGVTATSAQLGMLEDYMKDAEEIRGANDAEQAIKDYDKARGYLDGQFATMKRLGISDPKINELLTARSMAKGEMSADIARAIDTGDSEQYIKNGKLVIKGFGEVEIAGMDEGAKAKLKQEIKSHFGRQYGELVKGLNVQAISDYDMSSKHHQRMDGAYVAAMGKEELKLIDNTMSEVGTPTKNAILNSKVAMDKFEQGDYAGLAEGLRLISQGQGHKSIFAEDTELLNKLSSAKSRADAGKMAGLFGRMTGDPNGLMSGDHIMNAENTVAMMMQAAMGEHLKNVANSVMQYNERLEANYTTAIQQGMDQAIGATTGAYAKDMFGDLGGKLQSAIRNSEGGRATELEMKTYSDAMKNAQKAIDDAMQEGNHTLARNMEEQMRAIQAHFGNVQANMKLQTQTDRVAAFYGKLNNPDSNIGAFMRIMQGDMQNK